MGSTSHALYVRVCEQLGKSHRTNRPLSTPAQSAIRGHSQHCSADVLLDNFSIIGSATSFDLRILESPRILKLKPDLNDMVLFSVILSW